MGEMVFNERLTGGKDWATIVFILCFAVIAINKAFSENRFSEFLKLAYSDKYNKIYKESGNLGDSFTISFFIVQVISFGFFCQLLLSYFNLASKTNWVTFARLSTFIAVFILCKYLLEKIIATSFKIEEFNEQFNLIKVNYRTYAALLLLPVNVFLFYNDVSNILIIRIITGVIIGGIIGSYLISLRIFQKLIIGKVFYFILYLCALEIAPYYFLYYWFTKR
ncbi:DUF4271 domain-containing protein [Flavobacterium rhizosphaerae]|uniref:DUF4271 domain-containing protein n=1 Tax=Flavobacterium rhizosphaerae TaxID=3163298 RepID=A0ABW8YZI2_9FLAO